MEESLIIFVKNPEIGKVKSRLAKVIGAQKALNVYNKLLAITHNAVLHLPGQKFVYYSNKIAEKDVWENEAFEKRTQHGKDLGERMYNAIREVSELGNKKVCLIGSDIPELSGDIVLSAFKLLSNCDIVIGPATDGGYYLIAMKSAIKPLFVNKPWSKNTLLQETVADIEELKLNYGLLPMLTDIDFIEDIHDLKLESLLS